MPDDTPPHPLPPLTISLRELPELIWAVRREMATFLRHEADAEPLPAVARRLRELADQFEAGATR